MVILSKKPWNKNNQPSDIVKKYGTGFIYPDEEQELIDAIIRETCKEYKEAYRKNNRSLCITIERWFHSETFDLWTHGRINPDKVIEELQDQVNRNKFRVDKSRVREKRCDNDN